MIKSEILKQKGHNFLWIKEDNKKWYLWMWDTPIEDEDQKAIAEEAFGDVLVAGYGLGIVQRNLMANPNVKSLLTVELYKEVIDECRKVYGIIYGNVDIGNFYNYKTDRKFDCIIGDIWPDQSRKNLDYYVRFKRKAGKLLKPEGKILGWGMDFMEFLLNQKKDNF